MLALLNDALSARLLRFLRRWPDPAIALRDFRKRAPRKVVGRLTAEQIVDALEREGHLLPSPPGTTVAGERRKGPVWRIVGWQPPTSDADDEIAPEVPADTAQAAERRAKWKRAADRIDAMLGRHRRGDFTIRRWRQVRLDARRFVSSGSAHRCLELGWHPLELLGADRQAPWLGTDRRGLMLCLDGGRIVDLNDRSATIETPDGARFVRGRRPLASLDAVLIDCIAPRHRLALLRPQWDEVRSRLDRCRPPQDYGVSALRWDQFRSDVRALASACWDYPPGFFLQDWDSWNGRGCFPTAVMRSLAWVMNGTAIRDLTPDVAVCGTIIFRKLPGDYGWRRDGGPHPPNQDLIRERAARWFE
jgi:hypothetical protein